MIYQRKQGLRSTSQGVNVATTVKKLKMNFISRRDFLQLKRLEILPIFQGAQTSKPSHDDHSRVFLLFAFPLETENDPILRGFLALKCQ